MRARRTRSTVLGVYTLPLSDHDFDRLKDLLDQSSSLDTWAVLGVFHAVAVAPGIIPPSRWATLVVVPERLPSHERVRELVTLLLRLLNEVVDRLERRSVHVPDEDDHDGLVAFADGYARAAALDPRWRDHDDRWTFAAPLAHFAKLYHLVPTDFRAKLVENDGDALFPKFIGSLLITTHKSFREARLEHASPPANGPRPKVGRNEPCTCSSGLKFKRCCLLKPPAPST